MANAWEEFCEAGVDIGIMEALDPGKDQNVCHFNVQSQHIQTQILSLTSHHSQRIPYGRRVEQVVKQEIQILQSVTETCVNDSMSPSKLCLHPLTRVSWFLM